MVIGVGHQLRRLSDGARFDVMWVGAGPHDPHLERRNYIKLKNLATGRHHWVLLENWFRRYEQCPAL